MLDCYNMFDSDCDVGWQTYLIGEETCEYHVVHVDKFRNQIFVMSATLCYIKTVCVNLTVKAPLV